MTGMLAEEEKKKFLFDFKAWWPVTELDTAEVWF